MNAVDKMRKVRTWWVVYSALSFVAFFGATFAGQQDAAAVIGVAYLACSGVLFLVGLVAQIGCIWLERQRALKFPAIDPSLLPEKENTHA